MSSKTQSGDSTISHILAFASFIISLSLLLTAYVASAVYPGFAPASASWLFKITQYNRNGTSNSGGTEWRFDAWRWCSVDTISGLGSCNGRKAFWEIPQDAAVGDAVMKLGLPK